jgi:exonuclease III
MLSIRNIVSALSDIDNFNYNEIPLVKENIRKIEEIISDLNNLQNYCNEAKNKLESKVKNKNEFLKNMLSDFDNSQHHSKFNSRPKLLPNINLELTQTINQRNYIFLSNFPIQVEKVSSIDEVPNYPLYYNQTTDEFVFKINDVVYKGNLENVTGDKRKRFVEHFIPFNEVKLTDDSRIMHIGGLNTIKEDINQIRIRKCKKAEIKAHNKFIMQKFLIMQLLNLVS